MDGFNNHNILDGTHNALKQITKYQLKGSVKSIATHTYCDNSVDQYADMIFSHIPSLYFDHTLQLLIDNFALQTLEKDKPYILIKNKHQPLLNNSDGIYYWGDHIEISSLNIAPNKYCIAPILMHEISHSVMHYVYNNGCDPYRENDIESEVRFENAERETLINFYKKIYPWANPNITLKNKSSWEIGNMLKESGLWSFGYITFEEKFMMYCFLTTFMHYNQEENHREFIARLYQCLSDNYSEKTLNLIAPIKNYSLEYIEKELAEFNQDHEFLTDSTLLTFIGEEYSEVYES